MKILKIDDNQGFFLKEESFLPIDQIDKDDLLRLVDLALESKVEFDEYDDEVLKNPAHQILYKNIFNKLRELSSRKKEYKDEVERLFLEEYEKYGKDISTSESQKK